MSLLKQLKTQMKEAQENYNYRKKLASDAAREAQKAKNILASINLRLSELKERELIVSEHAKLRFIERVIGIDLTEIETRILTEDVKRMHGELGNGKFPNGECRVVVADNVVVTVEVQPYV